MNSADKQDVRTISNEIQLMMLSPMVALKPNIHKDIVLWEIDKERLCWRDKFPSGFSFAFIYLYSFGPPTFPARLNTRMLGRQL